MIAEKDDRFTREWVCPKCGYVLDPFDDYLYQWECPECEWTGSTPDSTPLEQHPVRITWMDCTEGEGASDLVTTYCCSATPCYYVVFPSGYEGYFAVSDVEVLK